MEDEATLETSFRRPPTFAQPRLLIGLVLILAGLGWALARGLASYGIGPAELGYDLDQPPILLALVGAWLLWRGRRG